MSPSKAYDPETDISDLSGKVIIVTGGNTGLGKEAITQLAKHNPAHIYMAARTASKAENAIKDIKAIVPNAKITHLPLDLMSFESIRNAAETFKKSESRLDILMNNAGIMAGPLEHTKEGYESQFGTNHMGPFLLTRLLLPTMLKTAEEPGADVRIVNLASLAHNNAPWGGLILDQAELSQKNTWTRYGQSKLAAILFARELAKRYPSITPVSVHPGVILTDLWNAGNAGNPFLRMGLGLFGKFFTIDIAQGTQNQLWAATAPKGKDGVQSGQYYVPVGKLNSSSSYGRDVKLAEKLWDWSEAEVKKHGF